LDLEIIPHGHWIHDGLMTIFILLIGLEPEREICQGELSNIKMHYFRYLVHSVAWYFQRSYILQHLLRKPVALLILPPFAIANTAIVPGGDWLESLGQRAAWAS
jgi:Na+/H+ antiporter NhaA